jgi:amphi-Trp domain-containing protein
MDKTDKEDNRAREGKFTYESVQDAASLVEYLQALTDGFAKGSMSFSRKDLDLTLCPTGLIGFAVEAKGKDGRMKLNLKFTWREDVKAKDAEKDTLAITPGQPGREV